MVVEFIPLYIKTTYYKTGVRSVSNFFKSPYCIGPVCEVEHFKCLNGIKHNRRHGKGSCFSRYMETAKNKQLAIKNLYQNLPANEPLLMFMPSSIAAVKLPSISVSVSRVMVSTPDTDSRKMPKIE